MTITNFKSKVLVAREKSPAPPGYVATSGNTLSFATGAVTLGTQIGTAFRAGQRVRLISRSAPTKYIEGNITSLVAGVMGLDVDFVAPGATGTADDWDIVPTGEKGAGNMLAANYASEYVGHEAAVRSNIGAISIAETDYFRGLEYARDLDDAGVLMVSAGMCHDSTGTVRMALANPIKKRVGSLWVAGDGNGAMDVGSFVDGCYFVHLIGKADGTTDVMVSSSPFNPIMPSGYIYRRLIGSYYATGAGIWPFTLAPDGWVMLHTRIDSVSLAPNGPPYSYLRLMTVPIGVKCEVLVTVQCSGTDAVTWPGGYVTINDPDNGFVAPDTVTAQFFYAKDQYLIRTDKFVTSASGGLLTGDTNTDPPIISMSVRGWRFDRSKYR